MPMPADLLAPLNVIDRLEVGPVKVEKRRLTCPYRVVQDERSDVFEFQYSYDEDVFDPAESASQNLASMMAAQVALNYGLFCTELVFHGAFDRSDRQFLKTMAKNTAREIYVKKFLEPNPFLVSEAVKLPVVKQDSYLRARLVFADDEALPHLTAGEAASWATDRTKHAILASGGKDSLLSYGLLAEIGCETHAIFVNESGRHWFSAVNAHRHFAANVPKTARVWTNSDRLFAWMLRHLPFVRQDFAKLRSDEYPIRLWTVAVFAFAALPLLHKRGIGRLVIGDEYDTTVRKSYRGVTHYDGLYDQSRFFDNAMTRYYQQKRWNVAQCSLLRPLSELLIQTILTKRYPDLQRHQVSCHAATVKDERAYPCGKCEKCRRIVGMLKAIGADPRRCGYTNEQVERCLSQIVARGTHQERPAIEQLALMLWNQGLIPEPALGAVRALERPVVLKLRFDPHRSPIDGIPADLRTPLYKILLASAQGAVKRNGRLWIDFDPLDDPAINAPYPFGSPAREVAAQPTRAHVGGSVNGQYVLGELTWPQAEQRFREVDVALLPVGAIEQHGPHLPLDTDAFDADYLARRVAEACSDPKPILLPLIPYGVSYHHEDFTGTISISNETLSRLVYEIGISAAKNGITKLVIINGHGGNAATLNFAAQTINRDAHIFTCIDTGETSDTDVQALAETPNDVHAGEIETSTALAARPELVQMNKAKRSVPRFSSRYLDFSSKRSVDWYARTAKLSTSGVMGDPTKATREKGERMWEVMIRNLVEFIEQLKRMSLSEIHQRHRY
ncbi:MAG TPA: creatininase family protein [Thermoguttaceae bacterium]|nr:creatininase family protein [Thermoguttaceae bacterium]HUU94358.1 creatininase family protein [Phycisphaerae bacterium]